MLLLSGTGFQPVQLLFSAMNHRLEACATEAILIPFQYPLSVEQ
jgi:hypothetical protein